MEALFLCAGLAAGGFVGWVLARLKHQVKEAANTGLGLEEINQKYISREFYLGQQDKLESLNRELTSAKMLLAGSEQQNRNFAQKLEEQKKDLEKLQENFRLEFRNLANDLLDEKSKKFVALNQEKLGDILHPLREKLDQFEKKVESTYNEENKDRSALKEQLRLLVDQTKQVGEDATRLALALKGDSKMQGDWGEVQLEMILEKAGLQREVHYLKQPSYKDEEGSNIRPDYLIRMPEEKHLVIDSKVSLTAYERYFNAEDEAEKKKALQEHINSLSAHITLLSSKNYQQIAGTNQPDYVMIFVPIEQALSLALREDSRIFEKALDKNIVLVSGSTLLATLRTISFMWRQENQRKNVVEIARESGALYDKFVGFLDDMVNVGRSIDTAKEKYVLSMNKLTESARKGDTIIGRIERLKALGANTAKQIPQPILDRIADEA